MGYPLVLSAAQIAAASPLPSQPVYVEHLSVFSQDDWPTLWHTLPSRCSLDHAPISEESHRTPRKLCCREVAPTFPWRGSGSLRLPHSLQCSLRFSVVADAVKCVSTQARAGRQRFIEQRLPLRPVWEPGP